MSRSAQVVFRQRHPIGRADGQDILVEEIFGMVNHLAPTAAKETVSSLFLLQHESKVFRGKERRAGIDHLSLPEGSLRDFRSLVGFLRVIHQYGTGNALADFKGAAEGLRLMID